MGNTIFNNIHPRPGKCLYVRPILVQNTDITPTDQALCVWMGFFIPSFCVFGLLFFIPLNFKTIMYYLS